MKTHKKQKASEGIAEELEIPSVINAEVNGNEVILSKDSRTIKRKFPKIILQKKENKIQLSTSKGTKKEKKMLMTSAAHLYNMIRGLQEDFGYKLKICSVHFPMTVTIDKSAVVIKNFLGEKVERRARIMPNVDVQVKGDEIIIKSFDVENAGQTAANIEKATKISNRDRRVFQDGIFLTERKGEKI